MGTNSGGASPPTSAPEGITYLACEPDRPRSRPLSQAELAEMSAATERRRRERREAGYRASDARLARRLAKNPTALRDEQERRERLRSERVDRRRAIAAASAHTVRMVEQQIERESRQQHTAPTASADRASVTPPRTAPRARARRSPAAATSARRASSASSDDPSPGEPEPSLGQLALAPSFDIARRLGRIAQRLRARGGVG